VRKKLLWEKEILELQKQLDPLKKKKLKTKIKDKDNTASLGSFFKSCLSAEEIEKLDKSKKK